MGLTKVGEITPPLTSGQVTISIGTNPNDAKDGYFYFNTGDAPSLIKFKALLEEASDSPLFKPFYKTDVKKFSDANSIAQGLSKKEHLQAYASVLAKMGVVKSNKVSKVKKYNDIIDNVETTSKSFYKPSGLKASLETLGVSPNWDNYEGHFIGTLVNPVCLTQDKDAIEENPFYVQNIKKVLEDTNITLMGPVAFLREANWVVSEGGISLQTDGGADFTDLVLGMLNTSASAFVNMVKDGDGSASSLGALGVDPNKLGKAARNYTECGATGNEKIRNACIALGGTPSEAVEATEDAPKSVIGEFTKHFRAVQEKYEADANPAYLGTWKKLLAKLKERISNDPTDEALKNLYVEWLEKFKLAKSGGSTESDVTEQVSEEKDEATIALEAKIQELEDRLNTTKANNSLGLDELVNEYSFLMGTCQQIAATPNYKAIFKRAGKLKEQFTRVLDGATAEIMNNQELKKELIRQIKEAAKVSDEFKAEGERLWEEFREYTTTIASPLNARVKLEKVENKVKEFQKKVEQRSRGLILLSKKAGVGNATKISEHMTAVRSRATKLKIKIQDQLNVAKEALKKMETLLDEYYKTFDPTIEAKIQKVIDDFRKITFEL